MATCHGHVGPGLRNVDRRAHRERCPLRHSLAHSTHDAEDSLRDPVPDSIRGHQQGLRTDEYGRARVLVVEDLLPNPSRDKFSYGGLRVLVHHSSDRNHLTALPPHSLPALRRMQSMVMRVVVSGSGKMGRQVIDAVRSAPDLEPVAVVDGLAEDSSVDGLPLYQDADKCLEENRADVVVDFTNASWTPTLAKAALGRGTRLVIGTTGLPEDFIAWLEAESRNSGVGAVLAANFAVGAVLMMHFASLAAPYFDAVEVIELHHAEKADSPSGTAKTTAELMREARGSAFDHVRSEHETIEGARGAEFEGVAIHSVRLPGLVAHQEVIFGGLGQTLAVRHDSMGRDSFMPGVLMAAREVMKLDHLVVGLDRLLGLERPGN